MLQQNDRVSESVQQKTEISNLRFYTHHTHTYTAKGCKARE